MDFGTTNGGTFQNKREESFSSGKRFEDTRSVISKSDQFRKTGFWMTTINMSKLYLGIGILAFPNGFKNSGLFFCGLFIFVMTFLNTYSQMIQIDCKNQFGPKCKTFADLAEHVYGPSGRSFASFHVVSFTIMCCMAYVLFFIE